MSAPAAYGEKPPLQGYRRSFTAPPRQLSFHERAGLDRSDADSGLLYQHPAVRIISFEPPRESIVSKNSETDKDADYPIDTIETLPWRSRTEDLMASGPMRIEKVQGSVNFLKCGPNFVHSILRNSQCWCVDGESKFVLRKGKLQYYRIELPNETAEDKAKVEELKTALATVIKFEKTPCPFKRAFSVDLPDDAITPRRKGKWKARDSPVLSSPDPGTPTVRKWRSSRPSAPYTPPSSFPDSFNKRRTSDFNVEPAISSPLTGKAPQLERRSSVAERRAAFENLHTSSKPSSRPQTPLSATSSDASSQRDPDESESQAESDEIRPPTDGGAEADSGQEVDLDEDSEHVTVEEDKDIDDVEDVTEPSVVAEQPTAPALEVPMEMEAESITSDQRDQLRQSQDDVNNAADEAEETVAVEAVSHEHEPSESEDQEPEIVSTEPIPSSEQLPDEEGIVTSEELRQESVVEVPKDVCFTDHNHDQDAENEAQDDAQSVASTTDSFHTIDQQEELSSPHEDVDPTPMAESFDPLGAKLSYHKRDVSEVTVTASTFSGVHEGDTPGTPRLIKSSGSDDSWPDIQTPSAREGLRQRLTSGRSLSPLPPSSTIVSPRAHQPGPRITAEVIQKAAVFAVTKPVEVVVLVITVLARIAGGATLNDLLSGTIFQQPPQRRRHARNPSFPDHVVSRDDDDSEDDFGIPIRGRSKSSAATSVPRQAPIKEERESDVDSIFADDLD